MPERDAHSKPTLARTIAAAIALAVTLAGCVTTPVAPVDVGGSRADATVVMGATASSAAAVDWKQGLHLVAKRCGAWGFRRAQAFSGTLSECQEQTCTTSNVITSCFCTSYTITRTYQCLE